MQPRPEDVFDEAFQSFGSEDRKQYKSRNDLSTLPPIIQKQLRLLQEMFNKSLRNEKQDVPEHVDHPPFHIDYVDSDVPNALAFRYGGYSFIAITVPLIYAASDICLLLSNSPTVASLLHVRLSAEEYNELHSVLFYCLVSFIVAHEFTHHVHGHVCPSGVGTMFPDEILDTGYDGNLKSQIEEIGADGYAIYYLLANLFEGSGRSCLSLLKLDSEQPPIQDEVLLSIVIIAIGAYLFMRPAPKLNKVGIYKLTHPPQVARMDCLRQEAINWCRRNRPGLQAWTTAVRFQQLMDAATEATLGMSSALVGGDQTAFLQSEEGIKYFTALADGVNAYKRSL